MKKYTDDNIGISRAALVIKFLMANIYRHQIQVSQKLGCVLMLLSRNVDESECC